MIDPGSQKARRTSTNGGTIKRSYLYGVYFTGNYEPYATLLCTPREKTGIPFEKNGRSRHVERRPTRAHNLMTVANKYRGAGVPSDSYIPLRTVPKLFGTKFSELVLSLMLPS